MWFQSYLSNRSFRVSIKNKNSSTAKSYYGVPQRSLSGPLPFLSYVNDMKQTVDCDLFLYADASCLVYQHKDVNKTEQGLNKIFLDICDWFVDNKLSSNFEEDKTKSILFRTKLDTLQCKLNMSHSDISWLLIR